MDPGAETDGQHAERPARRHAPCPSFFSSAGRKARGPPPRVCAVGPRGLFRGGRPPRHHRHGGARPGTLLGRAPVRGSLQGGALRAQAACASVGLVLQRRASCICIRSLYNQSTMHVCINECQVLTTAASGGNCCTFRLAWQRPTVALPELEFLRSCVSFLDVLLISGIWHPFHPTGPACPSQRPKHCRQRHARQAVGAGGGGGGGADAGAAAWQGVGSSAVRGRGWGAAPCRCCPPLVQPHRMEELMLLTTIGRNDSAPSVNSCTQGRGGVYVSGQQRRVAPWVAPARQCHFQQQQLGQQQQQLGQQQDRRGPAPPRRTCSSKAAAAEEA